ncbi:MAG: GIY-YIG nuclease family protein [Nitrospirae bacterium]|nr:GIY-YIG nuclease family protein [Nitrospirota bacterium]
MYYVYLLRSLHHDWGYIGYTSHLRTRMRQHRTGQARSTRPYLPVKPVYYEAYISWEDARHREQALKYFGKAYGQLKRRLAHSLRLPVSG